MMFPPIEESSSNMKKTSEDSTLINHSESSCEDYSTIATNYQELRTIRSTKNILTFQGAHEKRKSKHISHMILSMNSKHSTPYFIRKRDICAAILLFLAFLCYFPGVFAISNRAGLVLAPRIPRSLMTSIHACLISPLYWPIGVCLIIFTIVLPVGKFLILFLGLYNGRKPSMLRFVALISKYQLVDFFVFVNIIGSFQGDLITIEIENGFFFFLAYCSLSTFGASIIATGEDTLRMPAKLGKMWFFQVIIFITSLVFICIYPMFQANIVLFNKQIILDQKENTLIELLYIIYDQGYSSPAYLTLITVVILPILAYIIIPLSPIDPKRKGLAMQVLHEWSLADVWCVSILVAWFCFLQVENELARIVPWGTYFNLLYGVCSFTMYLYLLEDNSETQIPLLGEVRDDVHVKRISESGDTQKTRSSRKNMWVILILIFVPLMILGVLECFRVDSYISVEKMNEIGVKSLANTEFSFNEMMHWKMPGTVGCCTDPCTDSELDMQLPNLPIPNGELDKNCTTMGDTGVLYSARIAFAQISVRWIHNLKAINVNEFKVETEGSSLIRGIITAQWKERLPVSAVASAPAPFNSVLGDSDTMCCSPNGVKITIEVNCLSDYPFFENIVVHVAVDKPIEFFFAGFPISDLRPQIEALLQSIIYQSIQNEKVIPFRGRKWALAEITSEIIIKNAQYFHGPLQCPKPSSFSEKKENDSGTNIIQEMNIEQSTHKDVSQNSSPKDNSNNSNNSNNDSPKDSMDRALSMQTTKQNTNKDMSQNSNPEHDVNKKTIKMEKELRLKNKLRFSTVLHTEHSDDKAHKQSNEVPIKKDSGDAKATEIPSHEQSANPQILKDQLQSAVDPKDSKTSIVQINAAGISDDSQTLKAPVDTVNYTKKKVNEDTETKVPKDAVSDPKKKVNEDTETKVPVDTVNDLEKKVNEETKTKVLVDTVNDPKKKVNEETKTAAPVSSYLLPPPPPSRV